MTTYVSDKKYKEILENLEKEFPDFRQSFLEEEFLVSLRLENVTINNVLPEEIKRKIAKILNTE